MRLEKKNEQELARRKGMGGKTIIQTIWLAISTAVAYWLARLLFSNGIISPNLFRDAVAAFVNIFGGNMSRSDIPLWVGWAILVFIIVALMQFVFLMGYAFASEEGRRKGGTPSMYSRNRDPFDDRH